MKKTTLLISAAIMLSAAPLFAAPHARLVLPAAKAPANSILSPGAVAAILQTKGYRVQSMARKGTAYSIKATGKHGNKVQMLVDGRSGEIVGLSVLDAAANLIQAVADALKSNKTKRHVDDRHPFGVVVPDRYARDWAVIPASAWATGGQRFIPVQRSASPYRYAVPHRSVRPGKNGRTHSTIPAERMREPVYAVYEADGALIDAANEADERAMHAEIEAEDARMQSEDLAAENAYLAGQVDEAYADASEAEDAAYNAELAAEARAEEAAGAEDRAAAAEAELDARDAVDAANEADAGDDVDADDEAVDEADADADADDSYDDAGVADEADVEDSYDEPEDDGAYEDDSYDEPEDDGGYEDDGGDYDDGGDGDDGGYDEPERL